MTPRKQIPTIEQRDDPNCECGKPLGDKGWCPECCEFRCATCGFVVHASFGAADDLPDECDECWGSYHPDIEVAITPTREQLLALLKHNDDELHRLPAWMEALSSDEERRLGGNILRLALLGLLVHPETGASTQADLDLEDGKPENARAIFTDIRLQALELAK